MRVSEFELKIFEFEQIRIVVRASTDTEVGDYNYERMASGNISVKNWLNNRVRPLLGDITFEVVPGSNPIYNFTVWQTLSLESLRNSYVC